MADFVDLFAWIQTVGPEDFPPAPFGFKQGLIIFNWDIYLKDLRCSHPKGPRARTGALQEDLRRLYTLWNSRTGNIK